MRTSIFVEVVAALALVGGGIPAAQSQDYERREVLEWEGTVHGRRGPAVEASWLETDPAGPLAVEAAEPQSARESSTKRQPAGSGSTSEFPPSSFTVRLGALTFLDDDLDDLLGTGFYSEIVFGFELARRLYLEFGSGYYTANGSEGDVDATLWGFPALLQGKYFIPIGPLELYGGAGVGMYFLNSKLEVDDDTDRDSDFTFGGNLCAGLHYVLPSGGYIGLEGKYTNTGDASLEGVDVNLDSFAIMFVSGFRF